MRTDGEPALAALFAALENAARFRTTGRRVKPWTDVKAQPAMFLRHIGDTDTYDPDGFFSITTLECEIWLYTNVGDDPNATPDTGLNDLVERVRCVFEPDENNGDARFTLGGLVYWCRIEGRSDYAPGDLGPQAIARIAVRITLP